MARCQAEETLQEALNGFDFGGEIAGATVSKTVCFAAAGIANQLYVGHELHADFDYTLAQTLFAPPAGDVE